MPISIPVSPDIGSGTGTLTTPAFSPPDESLLVVALTAFTVGTITISNTSTARTWTPQITHDSVTGLVIYTAPNPTGLTNITVSVSADLIGGGLKAWAVVGHDPDNPIGQSESGSNTANPANITGYDGSAGSRGFAAAIDGSNAGQPTSTDEEWTASIPDISSWGMALNKTANSGAPGPVTFNLDAAGGAAADWAWVALEILAPPQTARPRIVAATSTAVHRAASW